MRKLPERAELLNALIARRLVLEHKLRSVTALTTVRAIREWKRELDRLRQRISRLESRLG